MATVQRFEGRTLDDVLAQVRHALGDDAEIIEANRIKAPGGIGEDRYEVKARRTQKGQRRPDREAARAHVNPQATQTGEPFPGGLDDATVQAAMDHVQQVMADLERKRIVADNANAPSPTSLVDLADQIEDDAPELESGLYEDTSPSFAQRLADARAQARAEAPEVRIDWPELDTDARVEALLNRAETDEEEAGTVEWEPLDWSARRITTAAVHDDNPPIDTGFDEDAITDKIQAMTGAVSEVTDGADVSDDSDDLVDTDALIEEVVEVEADHNSLESVYVEEVDEDSDGAVEATSEDPVGAVEDEEGSEAEAVEVALEDETDAVLFTQPEVDVPPLEAGSIKPEPSESEEGVVGSTATPLVEPHHVEALEVEPVQTDVTQVKLDMDTAVETTAPEVKPDPEKPSWVEADQPFIGTWTDEAESDEAGWFETSPDHEPTPEFASLRNHRLVEWLSRNDLTPEALSQALEGLPQPDDLPMGPGLIIAVVGEGPVVLPLARRMAAELGADPAKVVLASEARSHASVPDNCRISTPAEASLDRRSWRRRPTATLVAVDTSTSLALHAQDWANAILESLQPHQVIALVDAGRKAEDVARWVADLGGVDSIALTGLEETVSPHAILELGIPVARLGTQVATATAWTHLLRSRRESVQ